MNSSDLLTINCMRVLSMEAIQKANSGHPGITMGAAPMAYELWAHHMKHNPINPEWVNRDRFVLSAGHGSMMLYSLLHLLVIKFLLMILRILDSLNQLLQVIQNMV